VVFLKHRTASIHDCFAAERRLRQLLHEAVAVDMKPAETTKPLESGFVGLDHVLNLDARIIGF
jgi:hypothetical protein